MTNQTNPTTSPSDTFKTAKWFIEHGYPVIPTRPNKRPYVRWAKYQKELPTHEEIKEWWRTWPTANVALITGQLSGVMVLDVDTEAGHENLVENFFPDSMVTPATRTPGGGWHYFFKFEEGLVNKARVAEGTDIRTEGGYVVIPPSENGTGMKYRWMQGLQLWKTELASMPEILFAVLEQSSNALNSSSTSREGSAENRDNNQQHLTTSDNILFEAGGRDEALFHTANCLIKGGMNSANAQNCLEILAANCNPPFDAAEIPIKIQSALDRAKKRDIGLTEEIREWVLTTFGNFSTTFVYNSLNLTTSDNKKKAAVILGRLCEDGIIERVGERRGEYRRVDRTLEFQSLTNAQEEDESLWLPLGLHQMVRIMPGNIIAVAGAPNAGKTGFLLNVTRYNFKKWRTRFLSSEMGIEEAADRISYFTDISRSEWQKHWEFAQCFDNFHEKLLTGKGCLNIIDYLEQPEGEAFRAASQLAAIHKNLDGAVACVALQKNRGKGRDTGVGGDQTLAKPRLYLAMDYGWAKIVKCKAWPKDTDNPNWKECRFKIHGGADYAIQGGWHRND